VFQAERCRWNRSVERGCGLVHHLENPLLRLTAEIESETGSSRCEIARCAAETHPTAAVSFVVYDLVQAESRALLLRRDAGQVQFSRSGLWLIRSATPKQVARLHDAGIWEGSEGGTGQWQRRLRSVIEQKHADSSRTSFSWQGQRNIVAIGVGAGIRPATALAIDHPRTTAGATLFLAPAAYARSQASTGTKSPLARSLSLSLSLSTLSLCHTPLHNVKYLEGDARPAEPLSLLPLLKFPLPPPVLAVDSTPALLAVAAAGM